MPSQKFEDFLTAYCNLDESPGETTALMRGPLGNRERSWLLLELDEVIASRSLSPELAEYLTSLTFSSQDDVDGWLRELRTSWYGDVAGHTG